MCEHLSPATQETGFLLLTTMLFEPICLQYRASKCICKHFATPGLPDQPGYKATGTELLHRDRFAKPATHFEILQTVQYEIQSDESRFPSLLQTDFVRHYADWLHQVGVNPPASIKHVQCQLPKL